ncbi:metal ABC transporter substrate-binding protein [Faecalispora anaeroviscerum]|uniref:metal ABC transporter substrate-binding protein n=1 Tax=Faecalispora anaeroviscerum TaxID=2991836 RepID=UPI0024BAF0DD|nr:metal ABC transporter substrate-binding protein [Faecalispora anaeroviscerum]
MKKWLLGFVSAALSAALLAGCAGGTGSVSSAGESASGANEGKKLLVYTSFYTMYDFAEKIGGDKVTVTNLVPPGTEPHDWEPQPNDIVGLEKANVFIYNGAGMEHWVNSVLDSIQNKKLVAVEASSGISLLEGTGEHEGEESHAAESAEEVSSTDPHVWLNPENAKKEMENIKNAFVQADPANKETYEANYSTYAAKADELDSQFKKMTSELKNKDLIVAHQAFGYLCSAYGLNQVAIEGLSPDSEPDAARMSEIIQFAKEHKITTIFFEEMVNPKVAETIAQATGAKTAVLDPIEGLSDENKAKGLDYFSIMEKNIEAIREANGS